MPAPSISVTTKPAARIAASASLNARRRRRPRRQARRRAASAWWRRARPAARRAARAPSRPDRARASGSATGLVCSRVACTSRVWSGCSRRNVIESPSACSQRSPPRRSATWSRRSGDPRDGRRRRSARSQVSGRSQGYGVRACSPSTPVRPSSSPMKTTGTPGIVICSPRPTRCRPRPRPSASIPPSDAAARHRAEPRRVVGVQVHGRARPGRPRHRAVRVAHRRDRRLGRAAPGCRRAGRGSRARAGCRAPAGEPPLSQHQTGRVKPA